MNGAEEQQHSDQAAPAFDLATWDWRADLKRDHRSLGWLARATDRSDSAVNKYARGVLTAPIAWLEDVARVLGKVA